MKKGKDLVSFLDELPHKQRFELAMIIHYKMYSGVKFFDDKDKSFIAWISPILRALHVEDQKYIYKEGEEITESKSIYFYKKFLYSVLFGEGRCGICTSKVQK